MFKRLFYRSLQPGPWAAFDRWDLRTGRAGERLQKKQFRHVGQVGEMRPQGHKRHKPTAFNFPRQHKPRGRRQVKQLAHARQVRIHRSLRRQLPHLSPRGVHDMDAHRFRSRSPCVLDRGRNEFRQRGHVAMKSLRDFSQLVFQ